MSSAFADTHNMVAILTKSNASEGFDQIIDFLNGSYIQYAVTVNPHIYVSYIKQFWNTVTVKQSTDVTRLQALVDRKKVVISEAVIRDVLRLDDAEGVDCLPNEEIFTRLARMGLACMGYEKPSTKLTFYKAFFSSQWKFLIHTLLQSLSAKRTSWNEFSSAMASAIICLFTGRKFNFFKYIFDSLVRNIDSSSKFYMYPRVGKGFSGVETPLFEGMLVVQENMVEGIADEKVHDDAAITTAPEDVTAVVEDDVQAPSIPSHPQDLPSTSHMHHTPPLSLQPQPQAQPQAADFPLSLLQTALDTYDALTSRIEQLESDKLSQALEITRLKKRVKRLDKGQKVKVFKLRRLKKVGTSQRVETSDDTIIEDVSNQERMIVELDKDEVKGRQTEKQAKIYQIDIDHAAKVLSMHEEESTEVQELVEVVTIAKLITEVVIAASAPVSAASTIIPAAEPNIPAVTITATPVRVAVASTRRRRGVVIRDPEELHEELNQDINWDVAIEHLIVPTGFFIFAVWLFAVVLVCSCCWNKDAILELTSKDLYRILKLTLYVVPAGRLRSHSCSWVSAGKHSFCVNTPRSDEDRLEILKLTVFVLQMASTDVTRLQALVDRKKVMISEAVIRDVLRLDDAEGVDCLPNEEIFTGLARMSSAMASAVICLSTGRKFNFSKYIFDCLVRNVDGSSKFFMYPRVGKGFSGVETPLFEEDVTAAVEEDVQAPSIPSPPQDLPSTSHMHHTSPSSPQPQPQAQPQAADFPLERVKRLEKGQKVKVFKLGRLKKVGTSQRVETLDNAIMEDVSNQGRMIVELDKDEGIELMGEKKMTEQPKDIAHGDKVEGRQTEKQAEIYQIDMDHVVKVLSMHEEESTEVWEVVEVVTTTKLITHVVTAASAPVSAASTIILAAEPNIPAVTITAAPVKVVAASTRRRKGVVIRDPEEESTTITPAESKSKEKKLHEELNQDIDWDVAIEHVKQKAKENPFIQRYQVMKKRPQTEAQARRNMITYLKNTVGFRLDFFKGMSYDDIRPIFEAKFNTNMEFLLKSKEKMGEEEKRAIKSINETPAQKAAKRRKLNKEAKEVEDLKQHLEIVLDEDDDIYTEATPLARKVPVVDYQIIHLNNKPRYKIIRADGTHQLYVSFITLLKNFDREDLESLWIIVKERFSTSKPNNFSDEYVLTTLRIMFGRPDRQDNVWKSQRSVRSQAMVKSWKLLTSSLELMLPWSLKKNTKCFNAAGEELSAVKHKLMLLDTAAEGRVNTTKILKICNIARQPNTPTFLDYVFNITDQLYGNQTVYDDPLIVTGIGTIYGRQSMFMVHQKGQNTKEKIQHNFAMPTPHGFLHFTIVFQVHSGFLSSQTWRIHPLFQLSTYAGDISCEML
uniref:acetyl-CoA carboxytransferase n=1 Tax=Tanacetum cinerariifolium TaxID=118510 RepID=A0A6L2MQ85_TANCI|nr:acetyl-coenzyme A carboxylase carboxyl transferase subunit alpha, chloroplastic [Tanacetum cinerariifolium]